MKKYVEAVVVQSEMLPDLLSLRAWDHGKKRLGGTALKLALARTFKPGDRVIIMLAPDEQLPLPMVMGDQLAQVVG